MNRSSFVDHTLSHFFIFSRSWATDLFHKNWMFLDIKLFSNTMCNWYSKLPQLGSIHVVPPTPPVKDTSSLMCSSSTLSFLSSTSNFTVKLKYKEWVCKRPRSVWILVIILLGTITVPLLFYSPFISEMNGVHFCDVNQILLWHL